MSVRQGTISSPKAASRLHACRYHALHRALDAVYQRARDRGPEHAHAIRVLGRAWCRVLWTCWQKRVPYDPPQHRAAQPFPLRLVDQEAA